MYTLSPRELFILSTMFNADAHGSLRKAFSVKVFRGHLEREGSEAINGLTEVNVKVTRVVYAREIQPDDRKSDEFEYILFGKGQEFFLAHRITQAPDFDHIVSAKINGHDFTPAELKAGIAVKDFQPRKFLSAKAQIKRDRCRTRTRDRSASIPSAARSTWAPSTTLRKASCTRQGTTESESADYALLNGKVKKKRVPSPGRLSTQMVPC